MHILGLKLTLPLLTFSSLCIKNTHKLLTHAFSLQYVYTNRSCSSDIQFNLSIFVYKSCLFLACIVYALVLIFRRKFEDIFYYEHTGSYQQ